MNRMVWCALASMAISQAAAAQDPVTAALTATANGAFLEPTRQCSDQIKGGDFRVSSGKSYYKTAMGQNDTQNRLRILKQARDNLNDAVAAGQDKLATTWYWMGRTNAALGNVPGADSAWTRAVALAPMCKDDIDLHRQQLWYRLLTLAGDKQKANDLPAALMFYRAANTIYRDSPQGYFNTAATFAGTKQLDSAEHYFDLAAKAKYQATDTNAVAVHNQALYNTGVIQLNAQEWPAAIATFHTYLSQSPADVDAKKGLAQAFIGAGMQDSARAVMAQLGMGPAVSPVDSLFNAGVSQFQAGDYKTAEATFAKVVEMQPYMREGLLNLANTQMHNKNGPGLLKTGKTLTGLEPLNEQYVGLLAAGFRQTNATADLNKLGTAVAGWPIAVTIEKFTPSDSGATISGTATGRDPKDAAGKAVKVVPVTLVFEFIDIKGGAVATQEVTIPALANTQTSPIEAKASGAAIVSYRYHIK
ncbi:MAG TPA: tetratricopeptide repeat protein [Gemmatimonadales bacterium]|nr:tetratricopeptide repeat protein [Gemmatimonadales bacterium]